MSNPPAKVINLADRRAKKEDDARNAPISGWITWLFCPKCHSLEYSEIEMPNGRVHKKCGTLVEEEEVEIDVRTEYTISLRNTKILEELFKSQNKEVKENARYLLQIIDFKSSLKISW